MGDKNLDTDMMEDYIRDNINELLVKYRQEFMQIVYQSNINKKKMREKPDGIQIRFSDIPSDLIVLLYNFIKNKMESQQ